MRYGSVCSGIEAATVAWHSLGWSPAFFSEIEKFPRAVLQHHWPGVPLHGDFTTIEEQQYEPINLLVGGTPCQSFSIAGLRKGLDDDRGNLALEYLKLAQRLRPRWLVWENVPGVLSSGGGRDFGVFLGGLVELGYGFAYRVLDAQYFGLAQRRKRVFVVGYLGDWRPAAAVLLEPESLRGDPAPRREAGQSAAGTLAGGARGGGLPGTDEACRGYVPPVTHSLRGEGFDASEDGTGRGTPIIPTVYAGHREVEVSATLETTCHDYSRADSFHCLTVHGTQNPDLATDVAHPLGRKSGQESAGGPNSVETFQTLSAERHPAVLFSAMPMNSGKDYKVREVDVAQPLMAAGPGMGAQGSDYVNHSMRVRRLTPVECERLQGFPDNFTRIPWRGKAIEDCPDGPRYKALGNSMAVPVMAWIGKRIVQVNNLLAEQKGIEIVVGLNCGEARKAL